MYNQYIKEHIYHEVSNITTMEFALTKSERYTHAKFNAALNGKLNDDGFDTTDIFSERAAGYLVGGMCGVLEDLAKHQPVGTNPKHVKEVLLFYKELTHCIETATKESRSNREQEEDGEVMAEYSEWSYQLGRTEANIFTSNFAFWPKQEEFCKDTEDTNHDPEYEICIPFGELALMAFNYIHVPI
jgi:hypothetical protein